MKTRIIVDSTADLVPEIKARVSTVPLTVHFGQEEYIDGVTIDNKTFYEKLIESDVLPTTSQATPDDYAESGLIWPGEANALVQNVSADAVAKDEPGKTDPPTSNPPTSEKPEKPTSEAPTGGKTEAPTSGTSGKESRGCQSSADAGWAILAILLSGVLAGGLVKKRRKD